MMLRDGQGQPIAIRREDYAAPGYWIDTVDLTFDLDPAKTRVLNRMRLRRNPDAPIQPLRLDGDELNLARVLVNGQGASFRMEGDQLVIDGLPYAKKAPSSSRSSPPAAPSRTPS
jgi:aminopeptidase N